MTQPDPSSALVLAEFHDRFWSDRLAGREFGLDHYVEQFPLHHDLIIAEYKTLVRSEVETDGETSRGLSRTCGDERMGHYRLIKILGRGGQAVVWLAEDERLGRTVALKVFLGDALRSPDILARFRREAALTAKIDHPGICQMLDLGQDTQPWIAMRYVPGSTLAEFMRIEKRSTSETAPQILDIAAPRLGESETGVTGEKSSARSTSRPADRQRVVLQLIEKVARAIHAAHELGIVHRDLKPNNIMIQPGGEPVVLDFGIAVEQDSRLPALTATGDVIGTPAYVSPEQIKAGGRNIDRRADIYALGVILFECLTSRRPFEGASRDALFQAILHDPAPRLRSLSPSLPRDLDVVVEMALQKNPDHRYADALALAEDLASLLENRPIKARPIGGLRRSWRWAQRNPIVAVSLTGTVTALAVGLIATSTLLRRTNVALGSESRALEDKARAYEEVLRQRQGLFRLRALKTLDDLKTEAREDLWPMAIGSKQELEVKRNGIQDWMARAQELSQGLDESDPETGAPGHRLQLATIRDRALPYSVRDRDADRRASPRFAELEILRAWHEAESRAYGIHKGELSLELPTVDEANLAASPKDRLKDLWELIRPDRQSFGREAEGLARALLLRAQIQDIQDPNAHFWVNSGLAFAELANGREGEEAREALIAAHGRTPTPNLPEQAAEMAKLKRESELRLGGGWPKLLADLNAKIEKLEAEVSIRKSWRFAAPEDEWWQDQLARFIVDLEQFVGEDGPIKADSAALGWSVEHRNRFLAEIERSSSDTSAMAWKEVQARMAANPRYAGLVPPPRLDLIPLGPDPMSGLEEFWAPAGGDRPLRNAGDQSLIINEETGLVFVLIPAGRFLMGAQMTDPKAPGYDVRCQPEESPPREVAVDAFYLAKFELTQGQYQRLADENPSTFPSGYAPKDLGYTHDLRHPLESISYDRSREVLQRFGFKLPEEAQWEYACRAGTKTPFSTGANPLALIGAVNIADQSAAQLESDWESLNNIVSKALNDGYCFHAPVGHYRPNPWGLHDMHGNVSEWCEGEVVKQTTRGPITYRCARGGNFSCSPYTIRSSHRYMAGGTGNYDFIGIRPMRNLR